MPIKTADSQIHPDELKGVEEKFLVFYSSVVDGKLWCPDCRDVEDLIQRTFGAADAPSALIVYVGDRPTWKSPSNAFRGEPWKVQGVPTVIKLQNGQEAERLVDIDVASLASFVLEK